MGHHPAAKPQEGYSLNYTAGRPSVTRMKPLFALSVLIFAAAAVCQQPPSLDVLLDRLDAYAKHYQATLPSLSCDEQITSQALNQKGKIALEVKTHSILREVRTADPYNPFLEKRELKTFEGRPSQMPYFVEGGFGGLVGFKRWEQRECFDYVVTSGSDGQTVRLEMTLKEKVANSSCARLPAGFHRTVIADAETGRILHTERTIAPDATATNHSVFFGAIDYSPQMLGGETFWLPSMFYAHDARNRDRMVATYSNCHRYAGELKILPNLSVPGAGDEPH